MLPNAARCSSARLIPSIGAGERVVSEANLNQLEAAAEHHIVLTERAGGDSTRFAHLLAAGTRDRPDREQPDSWVAANVTVVLNLDPPRELV